MTNKQAKVVLDEYLYRGKELSNAEIIELRAALVESQEPSTNNARDEICADILEYKRAYQMRLDLGSRFDDSGFINGILDIVKRKLSPVA